MKIYNRKDVADLLGLKDLDSVNQLIINQGLNYFKVGREYRFTENHIQDFITNNSSEKLSKKITL